MEKEIEKKEYSEKKFKPAIIKALKKQGGRSTLADVVVNTGLPTDWVEFTLRKLLVEYRGLLDVTDDGELLYKFDPSFSKTQSRWAKFRTQLKKMAYSLWRGFVFLFKIWIMVMLVVYLIIFLLMLLGLIFAKSSRDDNDRGGGFGLALVVFRALDLASWIYFWSPELSQRNYRRRRSKKKKDDRPPFEKVFAFVFGEEPEKEDPRALEKEILAYLRRHNGKIVAADLVALTGWSLAQAEHEAIRLMADYNGDVSVTEEGAIIYSFENILHTIDEKTDRTTALQVWHKQEPAQKFNNNNAKANWVVGGINGFNLAMTVWSGAVLLEKYGITNPAGEFFLFTFPLIFSSIFFLVPLVRWIWIQRENKKRKERNQYRYVLREIFSNLPGVSYIENAVSKIMRLSDANAEKIKSFFKRAAVELDGSPDSDDQGNIYYEFPRLSQEVSTINQYRN